MIDMAEDFFFENGEPVAVHFGEFVSMVLDLRGGQQATVGDVMMLGKRFGGMFQSLTQRIDRIDTIQEQQQSMHNKLDKILSHMNQNGASAGMANSILVPEAVPWRKGPWEAP
eukprot:gnl/TRDRNA2_/TRDRNA2_218907_c0_seq1.p1 gnl/TRDRNA2_/TRDRNA2_218907_c0~~gnl/TRDRNA2_/TRDRNA2_218907_c0_seq1.p1  ORF type:complete len:113 (+),score=23.99 gnl/TRDRNA2_/TRDRNA2_218907_c0_seq1:3-341(+)